MIVNSGGRNAFGFLKDIAKRKVFRFQVGTKGPDIAFPFTYDHAGLYISIKFTPFTFAPTLVIMDD